MREHVSNCCAGAVFLLEELPDTYLYHCSNCNERCELAGSDPYEVGIETTSGRAAIHSRIGLTLLARDAEVGADKIGEG